MTFETAGSSIVSQDRKAAADGGNRAAQLAGGGQRLPASATATITDIEPNRSISTAVSISEKLVFDLMGCF